MDGPRDCHTEWSKSYRERQISYDTAYMQYLKKKVCKWACLQNRNEVTVIENKLIVTKRERGDKLGDWDWHIHATIFETGN